LDVTVSDEKLNVIAEKLDVIADRLGGGAETVEKSEGATAETAVVPGTSEEAVGQVQKNLDTIFVLVAAALVFFMQAGFALLELGCVRARNCLNVVMKNAVDFCVAMICFLLLGFSLMFGKTI